MVRLEKRCARLNGELGSKLREIHLTDNTDASINQPADCIKFHWNSLPLGSFFLILHIGAEYTAIVQKTEDKYGAFIIFGYAGTSTPSQFQMINGAWNT